MLEAVNGQRFEITQFLLGRTRIWGLIEDRFGRVRRKFSADLTGHWSGNTFLLDETFTYDDGASDQRTWQVTPGLDGRFTAKCPEVVGIADGHCTADKIHMRYRFRVKIGRREFDIDFDDRTHRMEENLALNRATMRKWGVKVGELWVVFLRQPGTSMAAPE